MTMPSVTLERRLGGEEEGGESLESSSSQSQGRRQRYLHRIIEQLQHSRLHRSRLYIASSRSSQSHDLGSAYSMSPDVSSKNSLSLDHRKSISSEVSRVGKYSPTEGSSEGRRRPSTFAPSTVFHSPMFYNFRDDSHVVGRDGGGMEARNSRLRMRGKPPRIQIRSPSVDSPDYNVYYRTNSFSSSQSVRHLPPSSSASGGNGGGAGSYRPRPASPMVSSSESRDMFAWQICTPTNWKRGKSDREILLERKMLRRKGKQPSQSKFVSVFKLKEHRKVTAADRIRRVLKRAHFYGDDIKRLPIVRFRRAVRTLIVLLKTVKISKDKGKGTEPSTWIDEDEIRGSRKAYEMFGVSFDVYSFRAKREIQLTNEARAILTMAPGLRTDDKRHVALMSLCSAVPEFGEFPKAMQEALVRVGWYENFEARRIIIREGHMADNFYLILSGSAVVTIREQNAAGEYFGRTVAVLQRGNSFGELALIYGGTRSATVTCKDNVELLAVGRDDYIDIFMHKTKDGGEPEHLKFLKQIKLFCGWPIHELPLDDPSIFVYTYVRRGMVLCKDSNQSEWIYVIKSGSCRVLTALHAVRPSIAWPDIPAVGSKDQRHLQPSPRTSSPRLLPLRARDRSDNPRDTKPKSPQMSHAFKLPAIRSDLEVQESALKHNQELDEILRKRSVIQPALVTEMTQSSSEDLQMHPPSEVQKKKSKSARIFVNLQTLQAKDVYGLESVVMSVYKEPTRTSLVSDGAECIMISKRFFQHKLSEDVAKQIRREIRPLPSEEVLQEKLQTKTDWDTFRALTVADFVDFRRQMQGLHCL